MVRLADYRPPAFSTDFIELSFDLYEDHTLVHSRVNYYRTGDGHGQNLLILNAQNPNPDPATFLRSIMRNGKEIRPANSRQALMEGLDTSLYFWDQDRDELLIPMPEAIDEVILETGTYLEPQHNTALSGFYKSDRCFVTQCESEGFRRITPFLDRPDVMARYDVTISAPEDMCPCLLSNGNEVELSRLSGGRHRARFEDPWPKPSYLFATANGPFDWIEDTFTTSEGRRVRIRVYTDSSSAEKGRHAMEALKRAMKWDEETFGCLYDLDDYGVVVVSRFSMGAMENKGLNVFRDSLVLASPQTATDDDYQNIIDVIGHEYFHNYSGNRITNRNWFNLSLKEGLTVNREQLFTAYTTSPALERISAVQVLRRAQFPEDDSPNAHPVMPAEIRAVDNIYSATVYIKGSEVIRMMKTMMGEEKFIEGVKHYFRTYDGQAVTIQEFISSMEAVSGLDFSGQFRLWYTQSGRPRLKAQGSYNADAMEYTLTFEQNIPSTLDQEQKEPMLIPVLTALVDDRGSNIPLHLKSPSADESHVIGEPGSEEAVLLVGKQSQTFVFEKVTSRPAFHSLLRGFSAPVDLDPGLDEDQLHRQLTMDTDGFNRWDAGQKLALREMERIYAEFKDGASPLVSEHYLESLRTVLRDSDLEPNLKSMALSMPSVQELESRIKPVDPVRLVQVHKVMRSAIAGALREDWLQALEFVSRNSSREYSYNYQDAGLRRLKRLCLHYLTEEGYPEDLERAAELYRQATNMTDRISAMAALTHHDCEQKTEVFADFFHRFRSDSLTIQKYFSHCAMSRKPELLTELREVLESEVFQWDIPGHVQSLYRGFLSNYRHFHSPDGSGHAFLAEGVMKETRINGTTAAGMVAPLCRWRDYQDPAGASMLEQLKAIKKDLEKGREQGTVKKEDALPVLDQIDRALPEA